MDKEIVTMALEDIPIFLIIFYILNLLNICNKKYTRLDHWK